MGAQHSHAGAIKIALPRLRIQFLETLVPDLPLCHIALSQVFIRIEQTRAHLLPGLRPDTAEAQSQYKLSFTSRQVNFSHQRNVPVLGARVIPRHPEILREILPTVGVSYEAH